MQIKQCPTLRPTQEQFNNFNKYIQFLDRTFQKDFGMVIPPENWRPKTQNYESVLQNLHVKNAIEQNVQGGKGYYESKNIVQKKMPYKAYKKYAEGQSLKVKGKSHQEKEKLFWKTLTYSAPIYGADLTGSLMSETAGSWNFNNLDSLLKYAMPYRVKGVTEPYCYIGAWKTFFSWHKEDLDLSAINFIHQGQSKIWYSVAAEDSWILEECAKKHYRVQHQSCKQFLRHKTTLIHPQALLKEYPEAKISKVIHNAGQIVLVFGGAYHQGFNCGFNIAQAVNYATLDWLNKILSARSCTCLRKSVKTNIQSILYNLEQSQIFQELLKLQSFQDIRNYVQQLQIQEEANNIIQENLIDAEKQNNKCQQKIISVDENKIKENQLIKTKQIKKMNKNPANKKKQKTEDKQQLIKPLNSKIDEVQICNYEKDVNNQN